MRKSIVRTITATTIKSANLKFENGKPVATENVPFTVNGVLTMEKAQKEVTKKYGQFAQVTDIKAVDDVYEISVEDFIKHAKKVEQPTAEQAAEGKTEDTKTE